MEETDAAPFGKTYRIVMPAPGLLSISTAQP
jgi:hypothetical protein